MDLNPPSPCPSKLLLISHIQCRASLLDNNVRFAGAMLTRIAPYYANMAPWHAFNTVDPRPCKALCLCLENSKSEKENIRLYINGC